MTENTKLGLIKYVIDQVENSLQHRLQHNQRNQIIYSALRHAAIVEQVKKENGKETDAEAKNIIPE